MISKTEFGDVAGLWNALLLVLLLLQCSQTHTDPSTDVCADRLSSFWLRCCDYLRQRKPLNADHQFKQLNSRVPETSVAGPLHR